MKPDLFTNRDAAITTHGEENVPARAYELYEVRGRIDGPCGRRLVSGRRLSSGKQERKPVRASTSKIIVKIVGEA
jgi:hypothetical protein